MAGSRRHAPGITDMEPLLDVLVHGQDIAVPIGRPRTMPLDAAAAAATRVWTLTGGPSRPSGGRPRGWPGSNWSPRTPTGRQEAGTRVEGPRCRHCSCC